ncbi:MAG: hypothetical protein INH37_07625, partial [Myxococcaceae bacterium]|nr:hypothetical protein [Myxococcaceae bacterium]
LDAGAAMDGGSDGGVFDAGVTMDGGSDGGVLDAGAAMDGGSDGGVLDAGAEPDGGSDAGVDGGAPSVSFEPVACGCRSSSGSWAVMWWVALLVLPAVRRRQAPRRP